MEDFDIISALNLPFDPHGPSQEDEWLSTNLGLLAEPLGEECPASVAEPLNNSSGPSQNAQPLQTAPSWFLEQSLQQQLALQHMLAGSFVSPSTETSINSLPPAVSPTPSKSKRTPLDEDEKRRRNTEASARFRAKKKQKESALLQSAKVMEEKLAALEKRNQELELEITWLRKLVLERDGPSGLDQFYNQKH